MSHINSNDTNLLNNQNNNLNQGQEPVQNENENHLIGNILAEDNSDSDIDDGGSNMNTKSGNIGGGGLGISGNASSGNQNTPAFGNGAKLGFGAAAGFGSIGANAPYGGAFNNTVIPDRVGSTPVSDLGLKYYGQHESPIGKKAFGLPGQGTSTNLTGATFSNLFAQPTDQYDGDTLIRRPSDGGIFGSSNMGGLSGGNTSAGGQNEIKSMPMHSFLSSIQQNAAVNNGQQNPQIQDSVNSQLQQLSQQRFIEGASGQTSNQSSAINGSGDSHNQNQQDIYRTKEYYDYYHNLKPKDKDPRMPQPIYIPELNDPNKKGGAVNSQVQGSTITTEDIEKKLSLLNIKDDSSQIQTQNNPIYQKLQGLQTNQDLQALQQMQAVQYQQFLAAAQQQAINQQSVFSSGVNAFPQGQTNNSNTMGNNFKNQNQAQGSTAISQNNQQSNVHNQNTNNGGGKSKKKGGRGANNAVDPPQMLKPGQKQPPPPPPPPQPAASNIMGVQAASSIPVNNLSSTGANNLGIPLQNNNAQATGLARIAGFQTLANQQAVGGINQPQQFNSMIAQGLSQHQDQQKFQQNIFGLGYNQSWPIGANALQNASNSLFQNQMNPSMQLNLIQSLNAAQSTQSAGNQNIFGQIGNYNQNAQGQLFSNLQAQFGSNSQQNLVNPVQQFYSQLQNQGALGGITGSNQNIPQVDPAMMNQYMQQFMKNMMFNNNQLNQTNTNHLLAQGAVGQQLNLSGGGNFLMNNPLTQTMAGNLQSNFNSLNQSAIGGIQTNLNSGNLLGQNPLSQLMANQQHQAQINNSTAAQNNFQPSSDSSQIGGQTGYQKKNGNGTNNSQSGQPQNVGNQSIAGRGGNINQRGGRGANQASHNNFNAQNQGAQRNNGGKNDYNRGASQSTHPMDFSQNGSNGFGVYPNSQGANPVSQSRGGQQQQQQQPYDMLNNDMTMSSVIQVAKSEFLEDLRSKIQNGKKIEIRDIKDHVVECSMDQYGSRFIQQKYDVTTEEEKELIFSEILPEANSLMNDVFGNYVVQKLFEYGNNIQTATLAEQLLGNVLKLTKSMYGCRVVQKALEVISLDQQKLLVQELKDSVLECIYDQNGNHVIQKCIEKMPNDAIEFIVESVSEHSKDVIELCLHTYGCRVIQRILENCQETQTRPIIDFILADIAILTKDQFGNYVIQHILEQGKYLEDKNRIVKSIKGKVIELSNHKFASNVVEKCLQHGSEKDKKDIIDEFLESNYELGEEITNLGGGAQLNGALYTMMKDRYGNYVIQKCIEASKGKQRDILMKKITACANVLRKQANYSRHVYNFIEKFSPEVGPGNQVNDPNSSTQQQVADTGVRQQNQQNMQGNNYEGANNAGRNPQYRPRGGGGGGQARGGKNSGSRQ